MIEHLQNEQVGKGILLKPETAATMHRTIARKFPKLNGMALGFFESNRNSHRIISHGGDIVAFHSDLNLFIDDHVGVFISMTSASNGATGIRDNLMTAFSDRYFAPSATEEHRPMPIALATEHAEEVAGEYVASRSAETTFIRIGALLLTFRLTPNSDGTITANAGPFTHRLIETRPYFWEEEGTDTNLQVIRQKDGSMIMGLSNYSPVVIGTRFSKFQSPAFVKPASAASLVVLLLTVLCWPVSALLRRRYRVGADWKQQEKLPVMARRIGSIALLVPAIAWIAVVILPILNGKPPENAQIVGTQIATIVGGLVAVAALVFSTARTIQKSRTAPRNVWASPMSTAPRGSLTVNIGLLAEAMLLQSRHHCIMSTILTPSTSNLSPDAEPDSRFVTQALSARQLWLFFVAAFVMIIGLQLDAFKHATDPDLETFFTPWHGIMYSGMAFCGATIALFIRNNIKAGAPNILEAIPAGFHGAVAGMAILMVSGAIDTVWHTTFGIEKGLEIGVSPSHLGIISGMFLVASAPLAMLRNKTSALTTQERAMAVVSAALSFTTIHIITFHASALGTLYMGGAISISDPDGINARDAMNVHGYVLSTVLLLIPVLLLKHQFSVGPTGMFVVTLMPTVMMTFLNAKVGPLWLAPIQSIMVVIATFTATGLVARGGKAVRARLRALTGRDHHAHPASKAVVLGATLPLMMWSAVFMAARIAEQPVFWKVHMWSGVLAMTAIAGAITGLCFSAIVRGSQQIHPSIDTKTVGA